MMFETFIKTDEQQRWVTTLREQKEAFRSNARRIDEEAAFPHDNINTLLELGYQQLTLPTTFGGNGFGVYDMVMMQELISSFDASTGLAIGWQLGVVGEIYEKQLWSEENLSFFAKEVRNGGLVNRIVSEAATGSPTRGGRPLTEATFENGEWVVNGRKTFSTLSPALTYFLTSAWMEDKQAIGYFLIHKDSVGLRIEKTWNTMAMRGTASDDVIFENVRVPANRLVEINEGPRGNQLNGWALHIPACYLGIAQAARDYALDFANSHSPNSIQGTIGELPNVQALLGEIELELMRIRHFLYSVAAIYDHPATRSMMTNELGAAKHTVVNGAITIVDKAMRVVGAKSLHLSNPLQRYYRDVRAGLHNPPMDDVTIIKLAQTVQWGDGSHVAFW